MTYEALRQRDQSGSRPGAINTQSALSVESSEAVFTATPTSAAANTGASLLPSPTTATTAP